jgi:DNA-binding FadR family transcriptional regulator
MGLLANYFFFQQFEVKEIYEMSRALEPTLSVSVIGHLTPAHFEALEEIIDTCSRPARTREESDDQLLAEIKFHEILAEACPNSFLSFFSKFMKNLIRDLIVFKLKNIDLTTQRRFAASNLAYHKKLVEAYRRNDREAAYDLMKAHVEEVDQWVMSFKAIVEKKFLYL